MHQRHSGDRLDGHPDAELLERFSCGRLDGVQLDQIEAHLGECPSCCQTLRDMSRNSDPFVAELVAAVESTDSWENATAWRPPQTIGRFQIREPIGHGGFGVVLSAYDPQLRRDVAIKIPRLGSFLTPELRERFLRESQAAAALDHPNIVPVYEAGEGDGVCYIASAYCRGPNLAEWLMQRPHPVDVDMSARLVADLADAVHHAHSRGILHRDLKPSNVLLEQRGAGSEARDEDAESASAPTSGHSSRMSYVPKITDFGLAKQSGDGPQVTASDVVMGTAGYMSPEQARGNQDEIGEATDVYSLGAILYELLTGRPPMVGDSDIETLQRIQCEDPIPPMRLRPKLPRDLATICLKCLEKEPGRRYVAAIELASDLRRFLAGEPIRARPIGALGRLDRWRRRKPLVAALSASLAASLLLIAAAVAGIAVQAGRDARRELDRKYTQCLSYVANASAARHQETAGHRFNSLEQLSKAAQLAGELMINDDVTRQIRDEAIACMTLTDLKLERQWLTLVGRLDPGRFAFDDALTRCAMIPSHNVVVLDLNQQPAGERVLGVDLPAFDRLALSRDGRFLAARRHEGRRVVHWRLDSPDEDRETIGVDRAACFAFDEAGERLCLVDGDGAIWMYELQSRRLTESLRMDRSITGCCFDRNGSRLAVWSADRIDLIDLEQQRVADTLVHPEQDQVQCVAFSYDDHWLVSGGSHHLAYVWNLAAPSDGLPVHILKGHQGWITQVAFSPDGRLLASSSSVGATRLWDYRSEQCLVVERGYGMRFDSDGRRLAAILDDSVAVFQVDGGDQRLAWRAPDSTYSMNTLKVFADGELVAGPAATGVEFWHCATGRQIAYCEIGDTYWAEMRTEGKHFELLTGSNRGLEARSVQWRRAAGVLEFGDPQPINLPQPLRDTPGRAALSRDGRMLAVVNNNCVGCLVDLEEDRVLRRIDHEQLDQVRLSPDGQWLASFDSSGRGIRVSSTQSESRLANLLPNDRVHSAVFSPDGKQLVVDSHSALYFFNTGSWKLGVRRVWDRAGVASSYRTGLSFSADGSLLAVSRPTYEIKLVEPATGRVLATLPSDVPAPNVCFPKDENRLLCSGADLTVQAWELSLVRKQLAVLGLNWQ